MDNTGALVGLRLREKFLRDRNSRVQNVQSGLSHFLNEHDFLLDENAEDRSMIMEKKRKLFRFGKACFRTEVRV